MLEEKASALAENAKEPLKHYSIALIVTLLVTLRGTLTGTLKGTRGDRRIFIVEFIVTALRSDPVFAF